MAKFAYIGGYGRSGSTLLEYLLTANPKVVACGEISSYFGPKTKARCTCRLPVAQCPVWSAVFEPPSQPKDHRELALTLFSHVSSNYEMMVDSSKTAWGSITAPFVLRRRLRESFQLIHIVRDPRAVCMSLLQRKRKRGESAPPALCCIWTTIGWLLANLSCEYFRWRYPRQYLHFRYEDLAQSPAELVQEVFTKLLPCDPWGREKIGTYNNQHQLHGNRMRRQPLSFADVREDTRWKKEMPLGYRRLVRAMSWPLRTRYGY